MLLAEAFSLKQQLEVPELTLFLSIPHPQPGDSPANLTFPSI